MRVLRPFLQGMRDLFLGPGDRLFEDVDPAEESRLVWIATLEAHVPTDPRERALRDAALEAARKGENLDPEGAAACLANTPYEHHHV